MAGLPEADAASLDTKPDQDVVEREKNTPWSSRSASPEPQTPSLSDLKKSLSFKNLKELNVRNKVWRRPGERRKWPKDFEQLVVFSTRGALRAFATAYGLRAAFNLIIVMFRLLRSPKLRSTLLINAIAGKDNWRFASMMGAFVFLFKWVFHGLRIYNPGPRGKGKQEEWHAATAGAISAIAVLCEKPSRRTTYAQQLFVRGLQGSYNMLHARNLVHIPNGDVLLFGLACGQIMYAWLMAPESLPPGYHRWITNAARVPAPVLPLNLARHRLSEPFPTDQIEKLLARKDITIGNQWQLEKYLTDAKNGLLGPPFAICPAVHPHIDSCKMMDLPGLCSPAYCSTYSPTAKEFRKKVRDSQFPANAVWEHAHSPLKVLTKSAVGTIRSASFLSFFVITFQTLVCAQRNIYLQYGHVLPDFMNRFILSRFYYWVIGFLTCVPMFIEEKKRRGELAMYVLPKALESVWSIARRRSYVPFIPGGEVLLTAAGLAQVMTAYVHDPLKLSGLVRTLIYQFVGSASLYDSIDLN